MTSPRIEVITSPFGRRILRSSEELLPRAAVVVILPEDPAVSVLDVAGDPPTRFTDTNLPLAADVCDLPLGNQLEVFIFAMMP